MPTESITSAAPKVSTTPATGPRPLKVGLTEGHGTAHELRATGPAHVRYDFIPQTRETPPWIRSPIKGFLQSFDSPEHDLLEAVLCPIFTRNKWVCSLACFQEAMAFSYLGAPSPKWTRRLLIDHLFGAPNCLAVIFWSDIGRRTMENYGGVTDERLLSKARTIPPAVRRVPDASISFRDRVKHLLFTGDFFRKGGVNVVDAFVALHRKHPDLVLTVCADEAVDFGTNDTGLRSSYIETLRTHPGIRFLGRVSRDRLFNELLPRTDVFLVPTYAETYGFAILEAMAFGIPVISTNVFAIPEVIENGESGLLVDVSGFNVEQMFRTYRVDTLPNAFREHVTHGVHEYLANLILNKELRQALSREALATVRARFSVERRNAQLTDVYSLGYSA